MTDKATTPTPEAPQGPGLIRRSYDRGTAIVKRHPIPSAIGLTVTANELPRVAAKAVGFGRGLVGRFGRDATKSVVDEAATEGARGLVASAGSGFRGFGRK